MDRRKKQDPRKIQQVNSPFDAKKGLGLKIALVAVAALLVVAGILLLAHWQGWITIPGLPFGPEADTQPVETQPDTVIHFVAGGDLNISDATVKAGQTGSTYDYSGVFRDIMPVLSGGDLTAVNLEGNLNGAPYGSKYTSAPLEMMQALRNAGVDFVQTANSCTMNNGPLGLTSTIRGIREAGMEPLGTYESAEEFQRTNGFVLVEVQGIRIALVAFTKGMGGKGLPDVSKNCVNLLYTDFINGYQKINKEGINKVLRAAEAANPDITIALLHWGSTFNDNISSTQKEIAKLMKNGGVDAIIGSHPHHVQPLELDKNGFFTAWSIGDLFNDTTDRYTKYSILLDLEITKDGETGKTKITGFSYTPIFFCYEPSGVRILRIREAMAAYESNNLNRVSKETYEEMAAALKRIESRVSK